MFTFRTTSPIFVADRLNRIIRHLAAQSGPYRDVAQGEASTIGLSIQGIRRFMGYLPDLWPKTAVSTWNGRLFHLDAFAV
jgi:hypothetical protein